MKLVLKWAMGVALGLLVAAFGVLSFMAGSPKDALYMVRYALPHMHRGNLKVGDEAPDARAHRRAAAGAGVREFYLTAVPPPGWRRGADLR
jgi:hypothetical protein